MPAPTGDVQQIQAATVRFAGDSGDGMQLAGMRFTDASAMLGNDVVTMPDYPAEIRAPAGSLAGVSGFQINFAAQDILTPGDEVDALIAMNPASLRANLRDVRSGGLIIVNEDEFTAKNLTRAQYHLDENPLEDTELTTRYKLYRIPLDRLNKEALVGSDLKPKDQKRCRNMYALGLICWLYDRPLTPIIEYLQKYFGEQKGKPELVTANVSVLRAGYNFGDSLGLFTVRYQVGKAEMPPGTYRRVTGNEAIAIGLQTAARLAGKELVYCSYPITPASEILHHLAAQKRFRVKTVQAEDEISAICAAIGASFAGALGATGTSGPGLALKGESLGLAVMTELPLVVIDVQRGGPSTGLPTKTEQGDLMQAMFGRNSESPVVVLAARSPADCFATALEASRIALRHMVPVILLSDCYLAQGAEPWRLPDPDELEPIPIAHPEAGDEDAPFLPYARDEALVRPWAIPGTPGLMHRIGGLEKADGTGEVSYDAANHERMVALRQAKIDRIADMLPPTEVDGDPGADLLVLGWGGTFGSITTAVRAAREAGVSVANLHLRHLNPLPRDLGDILRRYPQVLVPELNSGQLRALIRDRYLVDARGINKVQGQGFLVDELVRAIDGMLAGRWGDRLSLTPDELVNGGGETSAAGSTSGRPDENRNKRN